jgi:hypothetical protein
MLFQAITIAGQILLAAADKVPEFKIESCRTAEQIGGAVRNAQQCFQDEQSAKDTLRQTWSSFDNQQKTHCQRLVKVGGKPSYVELLTCLEMKPPPATPSRR